MFDPWLVFKPPPLFSFGSIHRQDDRRSVSSCLVLTGNLNLPGGSSFPYSYLSSLIKAQPIPSEACLCLPNTPMEPLVWVTHFLSNSAGACSAFSCDNRTTLWVACFAEGAIKHPVWVRHLPWGSQLCYGRIAESPLLWVEGNYQEKIVLKCI